MSWRSLVEINHDYPLDDDAVSRLRDFLHSPRGDRLPPGIRYLSTRHHSNANFPTAADLADRMQVIVDKQRSTQKRELLAVLVDVVPDAIRYLRLVHGAPVPKSDIEIRRNADGTIDEIVADAKWFHIEQMSATHWWIGIDLPNGSEWHVNLYSKARIRVSGEEVDGPFPAQEARP